MTDCYGFIIPLPAGTDTTEETFENSRVRQLVNDLLRENIPVFWAAENFTTTTMTINTNSTATTMHPKGTFIIPFSSEKNKTALITSIINDYNTTSEIEPSEPFHIPAYLLMTPLTIDAYELVEPKIAQHLGTPTRYGWPCYLEIAEAGGFLTMEFLLDNETSILLNNNDFNVFMWPYNPRPGTTAEQLKSLTNTQTDAAIRTFVNNGGGYIGSCYGAFAGSSGLLIPTPIHSLLRAYDPTLSRAPLSTTLSLSDSFMYQIRILELSLFITTSNITDTNHPLSFGLNRTIKEFFEGPWFIWLGKNTQSLATINDLQNGSDGDPHLVPLRNRIQNTPSWVTSHFGSGNVILFATHPEFVNNVSLIFDNAPWDGDPYYGRRTIFNALFYVTSKEQTELITTNNYPISSIDEIIEKTINLSSASSENIFQELTKRIENLHTNLSVFQNNTREISTITSEYINMSHIILNGHRFSEYPYYFCDFYSEYASKTLATLEQLEQVFPLLETENLTNQQIQNLTAELTERLQHMEELMIYTTTIEHQIKDIFRQPNVSHLLEPILIIKLRTLCSSFEIGLKYMPQMYFESLKLLHHFWYTYEAFLATQ